MLYTHIFTHSKIHPANFKIQHLPYVFLCGSLSNWFLWICSTNQTELIKSLLIAIIKLTHNAKTVQIDEKNVNGGRSVNTKSTRNNIMSSSTTHLSGESLEFKLFGTVCFFLFFNQTMAYTCRW